MTSPNNQLAEPVAERANLIFFDTEFIEDGKTIDLLSIGMVRADGATYYAECAEADLSRAGEWVKANVLVHLTGETKPRAEIARDIIEFAGKSPEFWAYYADYDWVALCQLYGTMMDLPAGWPMFCRDIKQLCVSVGNPQLPEQSTTNHHALDDALWTVEAYRALASPAAISGEGCGAVAEWPHEFLGRCACCLDNAHMDGSCASMQDEDCIINRARRAALATAPEGKGGALADIAAERQRQIDAEGWTAEHDDAHDKGEMARAAGIYALIAGADATSYRNARDGYSLGDYLQAVMDHYWPWDRSWFKATNRRRDLVKAGALIVAEIERMDRAALTGSSHP